MRVCDFNCVIFLFLKKMTPVFQSETSMKGIFPFYCSGVNQYTIILAFVPNLVLDGLVPEMHGLMFETGVQGVEGWDKKEFFLIKTDCTNNNRYYIILKG